MRTRSLSWLLVAFWTVFWLALLSTTSGCASPVRTVSQGYHDTRCAESREEGYKNGFAAGVKWAEDRQQKEWSEVIEESAKHGRARMEKDNEQIGKAR